MLKNMKVNMDLKKDVSNGINLYKELTKLWEKACMYARKWFSNFNRMLGKIPQEDRATEISLS